MLHDGQLVLQAPTTKVASFNSAGLSPSLHGTPYATAPMFVQVFFSAAQNASGSNTVTFNVTQSLDNATFTPLASGGDQVITLTTTPQHNQVFIPVVANQPYIRLEMVMAGAGGTPTITYNAYLGIGRP